MIFVNIFNICSTMQHKICHGFSSIPGDFSWTQLTSIRSFPPRLQTPGFPACLERNSACTSLAVRRVGGTSQLIGKTL